MRHAAAAIDRPQRRNASASRTRSSRSARVRHQFTRAVDARDAGAQDDQRRQPRAAII